MNKKLFLGLTAALVTMSSCSNNEEEIASSGTFVSINASMENIQTTRATVSDEGDFAWVGGDKICAAVNNNGTYSFTSLSTTSAGTSATFTGVIAGGGTLADVAVYPYNKDDNYDGSAVTVNLPASYEEKEGTLLTPMVAKIDNGNANFKYAGGTMKWTITVPKGATSVAFKSLDKQITGDFTVGSDQIDATDATDGSEVTFTFTATTEEKTTKNFYLPLPVGKYTGWQITVSDGTNTNKVTNKSASADVKRASLVILPSLEFVSIEATAETTLTDGVTKVTSDNKTTYTVSSSAADTTSVLNAIRDDINKDQPESAVITVEEGAEIDFECGYHHGDNNSLIETSNTTTKEVVIEGSGDNSIVRCTGGGVIGICSKTGTTKFKNIKLIDETTYDSEDGNNAWEFANLELKGQIEFENCTIADGVQVKESGTYVKFTNCKLIADGNSKRTESRQSDEYACWILDGSADFSGCTFTGYRAIKIHEAYGSEVEKVNIDNCTFTDITKKRGVGIGTIYASGTTDKWNTTHGNTTITLTNCTFTNVCKESSYTYGEDYIWESATDPDNTTGFTFTRSNNTVTQ